MPNTDVRTDVRRAVPADVAITVSIVRGLTSGKSGSIDEIRCRIAGNSDAGSLSSVCTTTAMVACGNCESGKNDSGTGADARLSDRVSPTTPTISFSFAAPGPNEICWPIGLPFGQNFSAIVWLIIITCALFA